MNKKNSTGWKMTVMKLKNIGTKKNPLAYTDSAADDFIEAVEEFFENASIEVHFTEVERIAAELADNGFSYWKQELLFNVI
jgi:hypothetical protein